MPHRRPISHNTIGGIPPAITLRDGVLDNSTVATNPQVGQMVMLYSTGHDGWQRALGAGWRNCLVLRAGHKWITLFHIPLLTQIRISTKEWGLIKPRLPSAAHAPNWCFLSSLMKEKVEQWTRYNFQFNATCAEIAERIIRKSAGRCVQ